MIREKRRDRLDDPEHSGGRIVVRGRRAVVTVLFLKGASVTRGGESPGHVEAADHALVRLTIVMPSASTRFVVIEPPGYVFEVKNEPHLKAWVGDRQEDAITFSDPDGFRQPRMVVIRVCPLDVEHAPELVDLPLLLTGPFPGGDGHVHEVQGIVAGGVLVDVDVDRRVVANLGLCP